MSVYGIFQSYAFQASQVETEVNQKANIPPDPEGATETTTRQTEAVPTRTETGATHTEVKKMIEKGTETRPRKAAMAGTGIDPIGMTEIGTG